MIVEVTTRFAIEVEDDVRLISRITGYDLNDAIRGVVERHGAAVTGRGMRAVLKYPHDPNIGHGINIDDAWARE